MKNNIFILIMSIFSVIGICFIMFVLLVLLQHDCTKEQQPIILIKKDSTIKQLKVNMNDDIQKALNANDSVAIKQFIELVTE